jgi:PAS domain S-box-containing protein
LYADVTAVFCKPASLKNLLNGCVEAIVRHLDAAFARIWTLNKDQDMLELQASAGLYTGLHGSHSRIPIGKLKIGLIAAEKKPHLTNDVSNDPRVNDKAWAHREGIVSFAGYPLLVESRLVGVLAMFSRRRLASDTLDALESVSQLIGQSIERKRMEEELRANETQIRIMAEHALEETGRRLVAQSKVLTDLTATQALGSVAYSERLRTILEASAQTLDVERVSVWEFTEGRDSIRCVDLLAAATSRHTSGVILLRDNYPNYFRGLERERLLAVADAHSDERTCEFSADYLQTNGIGAMLDVPLRQDDRTVGVLCHEHVGGSRSWNTDEQNFALSVANLVVAARADEERRVALERLAASEELARLVVDTAHDAFIGMGSDGRIAFWNAQAQATFGWSREEAIGRVLVETIVPQSLREAHLKGMREFHATGRAPVIGRQLELTGLHRDGREFPIEITISQPMRRHEGIFFGAFLRDISGRRQRERELQEAKVSAEVAARAKGEFLANMSHEMRTPLDGVLGYAQLLRRDRTLPVHHQEAVDAISQCGTQLLELVNDVLDLSKIEAGKVALEPVSTDLQRLVADVRKLIAEPARHKGLGLETHLGADIPGRLMLDERYLRQILINLLSNAVKFTDDGSIALVIERVGNRLRFEVSDTGIGIDAADMDSIFEAFGQTPAGAKEGGTGLGLTISQRLVRAMGGELRVESEPGRGSSFWFDAPLVADNRTEPEGARSERSDQERDLKLVMEREFTALIVDDHSVNRRIMACLLESIGMRTMTAVDGLEGIKMASQHHPDVILMDLRMAGMDGIETTRRLQANPATATIPVLAVTASPYASSHETAREAGCCGFIPKPVRYGDLIMALQSHLGLRFERVAAPVVPPEDLAESLRSRVLAGIAERLRQAAIIGSVSDLQEIALELTMGDAEHSRLGRHIARLTSEFEFEAIEQLASGRQQPSGNFGD